MRGVFGTIAFTLLLSMPADAAAQRPDSTYRKAVALELPTLPPPVGVHYSPGYRDRAAALQRGARAVHDLLRDSLGLEIPDMTLLVLDSADWSEVTELPYGLHTLLQDGPGFLAPAEVDRGIYHDADLGGREAELGVDVVGLHYLAHFYAAEALYGGGHEADPPVKWLDELFTLMLQDELLRAVDPALAEAATRGREASLRIDDPAVTTLAGFDREYRRAFVTPEGAPNYVWFLARLADWAREIRAEHGLRVMGSVREALARGPPIVEPEEGLDLLARVGMDVSRAVGADGRGPPTDRCDPLRAEVSMRAVLDPGGIHCYELQLERGDYALVVVRELGGDLAVEVTRPGETEPYQRVSRFWTDGFEQVAVVARTSGSHRIEIEPARALDRPAEYSVAVERLMSVEAQEAFRRRLRAEARIAWIERNSIEMRSIDVDADDFSDLAPLREVLRDSRVIMLGEQSHGDGSSNVARSRLIRYLHEELGFDVLAFEAGLYDMNRTWRAALAGREPDPLWS